MFRNTGSGQCPHVLAKAEFKGRRRTAGNSVIETYGPANIRTPTELAEGVVPDGGARSATLERMNALSLRWVVRGRVSSWAVPGEKPRWTPTGWRCEPAFFAYFLCGGKESECCPAQGRG